jgi:hypothetical protein
VARFSQQTNCHPGNAASIHPKQHLQRPRTTHGVGVARSSTQPSAVLSKLRYIHSSTPSDPSDARRRDGSLLDSQHRHTPSDVLQRPRPTIGVEDSQLLTLDILPHGGCDIPPAAVSATTYDARRENGSLLSKPNLLVSRHDTSSTHPKRCLQRPRPTNGVNGSQLLLFLPLADSLTTAFPIEHTSKAASRDTSWKANAQRSRQGTASNALNH